jgi:hydrogenase maturation protease
MPVKKILVYGYGNPGRQDDGLGCLFAQRVEDWAKDRDLENIRVESNYQLNIEDAAEIAGEDLVIFADASLEPEGPFLFEELLPNGEVEFTMHAVHPAFVLHLCESIYDKRPEAYLLHLRGVEWEFREGLSEEAEKNLEAAFEYIVSSGKLE